MTGYREHGTTGLDRATAALYASADLPAPRLEDAAAAARPSGERCRVCGYRVDAPGHTRSPHPA